MLNFKEFEPFTSLLLMQFHLINCYKKYLTLGILQIKTKLTATANLYKYHLQ